eukprot:CAMPEP_0117752706 /NCGR_PEP_ID=MMETSP0947-20121206/11779_1 /TAXON_ID=44440 /ORGANISM="Chattonella subsalsa, Strain CCMP2191" /LENGTH=592 /DNA_ID=CAMNT_0005571427 /DNA_START=16 /DNA_END=1795 /DNA_ORIENTATION=+
MEDSPSPAPDKSSETQQTQVLEEETQVLKSENKADIKVLPPYYEKNEYLIILYKKIRALKKKLDKCKKVEERSKKKKGKAELHEEQLVLLSLKEDVEKSLKDFETLRDQFEEIAKEEYEQQQKEEGEAKCDLNQDTATVLDKEDDQEKNKFADQSQQTEPLAAEDASTQAEVETEEVFTTTDENEEMQHMGTGPDEAGGVQVEVDEDKKDDQEDSGAPGSTQLKAPLAPPPIAVVDPLQVLGGGVCRMLRLLHLASFYSARASGRGLPMEVDFLSKAMLGKTTPPDELNFEQNLAQSVKLALSYITAAEAPQPDQVKLMGVPATALDALVGALVAELASPRGPPPTQPPASSPGSQQSSPHPGPQPAPEIPQAGFVAQPSPAMAPTVSQPTPQSVLSQVPLAPQPHPQPQQPSHSHSQQLVQEAVAAGGWHHPGPALHSHSLTGGLGLGVTPTPATNPPRMGTSPGGRGHVRSPSPQHQTATGPLPPPHPADVVGGLMPPFHPFHTATTPQPRYPVPPVPTAVGPTTSQGLIGQAAPHNNSATTGQWCSSINNNTHPSSIASPLHITVINNNNNQYTICKELEAYMVEVMNQ